MVLGRGREVVLCMARDVRVAVMMRCVLVVVVVLVVWTGVWEREREREG